MNEDEIRAELALGEAMTTEEAERMLARLRGFYRQPVQPISRYCDALRTWQRVLHDRASDLRDELFPDLVTAWSEGRGEEVTEAYRKEMGSTTSSTPGLRASQIRDLKRFLQACDSVDYTAMQIMKSSLLGRLIYGGEKLRTQKCPEHKGKWSGLEHADRPCPHGCEMTGWVRLE